MNKNLVRWGVVLGALPRILHYRKVLNRSESYFERLRIVNEALGSHWVFRLADVVGLDVIKENRPSWYDFYVLDTDDLHCPLDPGAPETGKYLGQKYSVMDMAFYAGMGFDGYRLALQTPRHVRTKELEIEFDNAYLLELPTEDKEEIGKMFQSHHISKQNYYAAYGDALSALFDKIEQASSVRAQDEDLTERVLAACLILLCGGHKGCKAHITMEDEWHAQSESMIVFRQTRALLLGKSSLRRAFGGKMVGTILG